MNWIKKHGTTYLLVLLIIVGLGMLAYPTFADWWNSFHQSRAVASYVEAVAEVRPEDYDRIIYEALDYNVRLADEGIHWKLTDEELEEYDRLLNINGSGIMGYIEIPKINIRLPVYHGTDEAVLQIAIGHIEGSSLPIGGESSHCVLSGHRGLPSARLFSDLDKMDVGDKFLLTVLDLTLTYEVDQILVVEPHEMESLVIEEGQDYCTLVTCTPYGINTHRMLVRGHRIETEEVQIPPVVHVSADALMIDPVIVAPFLSIPVLLLMVLWVLIATSDRSRRRRARKERQKAARRRKKQKSQSEKEQPE